MKKYFILNAGGGVRCFTAFPIVIVGLLICPGSWGAACPTLGGCGNQPIDNSEFAQAENCGSEIPGEYCTQYGGKEYIIRSCGRPYDGISTVNCQNGYKAVAKTGNLGCTYTYFECVQDVTCGSWQKYDDAHDYRICNDGSIEARCRRGAYGTAWLQDDETPVGCTQCPMYSYCDSYNLPIFKCYEGFYKNGSVCSECPGSEWSEAGSTSITDCIAYTFSDSSGSGTFGGAGCHYSLQ